MHLLKNLGASLPSKSSCISPANPRTSTERQRAYSDLPTFTRFEITIHLRQKQERPDQKPLVGTSDWWLSRQPGGAGKTRGHRTPLSPAQVGIFPVKSGAVGTTSSRSPAGARERSSAKRVCPRNYIR